MKAASRALSYFSWLNSVSWSKTFVFWLMFFTKKSLGNQGKRFFWWEKSSYFNIGFIAFSLENVKDA
jgi:hypothetical protein